MSSLLFYFFATLTVASAAAVVVNKNAVNAALCLLVSLVGLAGLFIQLDAGLLAFVLLLVYAGAVVALFLFIVMLLDTKGHTHSFRPLSVVAAALAGLILLVGVYSLSTRVMLSSAAPAGPAPGFKDYADQLFTTYLLPVQIVGFLLLVAMLGVIVISKRFAPVEDAK